MPHRRTRERRPAVRRVKQTQIYRETFVTESCKLKNELVPAIRLPLINEDEVTPVAAFVSAQGKVERAGREFEYVDVRIYTVPNGTSREWPE